MKIKLKYILTALLIIVTANIYARQLSLPTQTQRKLKIHISNFANKFNNAEFNYFMAALPKSVSTAMSRGLTCEYSQTQINVKKLKKAGYTHYIKGSYEIKNNKMKVVFSIYNLKTGMETIRAEAYGKPDTSVFTLIDNITKLATETIINPPAGSMFTTVIFIIDANGNVTTKKIKLTREQIQQILNNRDLRNFNFQGMDLSGVSLFGRDLTGANFSQANLSGTILSFAKLDKIKTHKAVIKNAFIYGVRLNNNRYNELQLLGAIPASKLILGVNLNMGMSYHTSSVAPEIFETKSKPNFSVGLYSRNLYFFDKTFGMIFDLGFQLYMLKSDVEEYDPISGTFVASDELNKMNVFNLHVGVGAAFRFINKIIAYVGPFMGVNITKSSVEDKYKHNAVNIGFFIGGGYTFNLSRTMHLFTGLEFKMVLSKFAKAESDGSGSMIMGIYVTNTLYFGLR